MLFFVYYRQRSTKKVAADETLRVLSATMKYYLFFFIVLFLHMGCSFKIGDSCGYDGNCSTSGDRVCDRKQPGGYCLIMGCDPDGCPSEAACVAFATPCFVLPQNPTDAGVSADAGSPYDDFDVTCEQQKPNRKRNYCLRRCRKDGDCRSQYECRYPEYDEGELGERDEAKVDKVLPYTWIIDLDRNDANLGFCVPKVLQ